MSFLDEMIDSRLQRLREDFGPLDLADRELLACCARPPRDFVNAVSAGPAVAVIAEVKKASPSAGPIAPFVEAGKQGVIYQAGGAAAISVLTETTVFGGSFSDLSDVADAVDIPVLCKDFVVDPVQLFVARGHGADAVLLMVSILGEKVQEYLDIVETLGMTALVEVNSIDELDMLRNTSAKVVGVNSRDLRTLKVDIVAAREVVTATKLAGFVTVAASGVKTRDDVLEASKAGADAVLVGETLMRASFPEDVLEDLTGVAKSPPRNRH